MEFYNYKAFGLNQPLNNVTNADNLITTIEALDSPTVLYHGYYSFEKRDNYKDYSGLLKYTFDTIHIDLDSKGDEGLEAWEQTKALCLNLQEAGCHFHVYFSGNKGFHIAIHQSALGVTGPMPHGELSQFTKSFLYGLKNLYTTVDTAIHDPSRKFRAYRSFHEKSSLYKTRLTGAGLRPSLLSLADIRELAKTQQALPYAHPLPVDKPVDFLLNLLPAKAPHTGSNAAPPPSNLKPLIKEPPKGSLITNDAIKYRNFNDKKCITQMTEGIVLPQFNRHDIELTLITEMRQQGTPLDIAIKQMNAWGAKVYTQEPERIKDIERQVRDVYKKDLEADKLYQFGCYGEIKSAYCSAKCKIYPTLDKTKRAEPLDCTKLQKNENEARRNPALEMSEGQLADTIIKNMPMLCKSNGQYFQWVTTHWKRIDGDMFEDTLVKLAMTMYGNQATIKKNKALAEHVVAKIPIAPESNHFFSSCTDKFNFSDCTAVILNFEGKLLLEKKPHNPNDYLAYCAQFPLEAPHNLAKGSEFSKYLATRLQDVGEDGVRIIKQMLGAALIPYVPRIFFIEGITNSGKSTLAKLIIKLLGQENVSEVLPVIKGGGADRFNWEPSIGKLANIVLELPKTAELDVNTLKMIRDKAPISIDRKQQKHVKATLPFMHIYCCNQMPSSFEGNSGALNNRVSMLFFKPGYLNGSGSVVEYAEHIWNDDAGSVLEVAREGLADLIESGFHYFNGINSAKMASDWQKMTDNITLYFGDVNNGEWGENLFKSLEGTKFEKGAVIYSDFRQWCTESGRKPMGKHSFYKELETRFEVPRKNNGMGGERFLIEKVIQKPINGKSDTNPIFVSY